MQLTKVVNNNITKNIVNSNIVEYNIKKAYPTILADINNKYEYLLSLTKSQYVDEINKIFKENPNIKKEVMNKTL
jgi:basic membrane lipoprotein Med (substrate-binding protein (PBP1-ABC) superfamily)